MGRYIEAYFPNGSLYFVDCILNVAVWITEQGTNDGNPAWRAIANWHKETHSQIVLVEFSKSRGLPKKWCKEVRNGKKWYFTVVQWIEPYKKRLHIWAIEKKLADKVEKEGEGKPLTTREPNMLTDNQEMQPEGEGASVTRKRKHPDTPHPERETYQQWAYRVWIEFNAERGT